MRLPTASQASICPRRIKIRHSVSGTSSRSGIQRMTSAAMIMIGHLCDGKGMRPCAACCLNGAKFCITCLNPNRHATAAPCNPSTAEYRTWIAGSYRHINRPNRINPVQ